MSAMMGTTWVWKPSIFSCTALAALVTRGAGGIELAEQAAQFAGIGLAQEGVQLLDQAGTEVFSCMDWSGSGPNSERRAAIIQPDRYR